MKRFIDLRNQGTGYRFAFWDTVTDRFEQFGGEQAWDTFDEFADAHEGFDLERYERLCPDWAKQSPSGREL